MRGSRSSPAIPRTTLAPRPSAWLLRQSWPTPQPPLPRAQARNKPRYNQNVKSWDVIVLGCGVIGASLARELNKSGMTVLVIERGEPGREASHAAAGMLAPHGGGLPKELGGVEGATAAVHDASVT